MLGMESWNIRFDSDPVGAALEANPGSLAHSDATTIGSITNKDSRIFDH